MWRALIPARCDVFVVQNEAEALKAGMSEMSNKFNEVGAKVYIDAAGLEQVQRGGPSA